MNLSPERRTNTGTPSRREQVSPSLGQQQQAAPPAYATLSMPPDLEAPACTLSSSELRSLVLDYCVHSGFSHTARELLKIQRDDPESAGTAATPAQPTAQAADGDVDMLQDGLQSEPFQSDEAVITDMDLRNEIAQLIRSGLFPNALALLAAHYPSLLDLPKRAPSSSSISDANTESPHRRPSKRSKMTTSATNQFNGSGVFSLSPGSTSCSTPRPSSSSANEERWTPTTTAFERAKSVQPTQSGLPPQERLLGLDLRIQAFIEALRQSNLSTTALASDSSSESGSEVASTSPTGPSDKDLAFSQPKSISALLRLGQSLVALTHDLDLPTPAIAAYREELNHASELFIYAGSDAVPINGNSTHINNLLDPSRRDDLAGRVNSAILGRQHAVRSPSLQEATLTHSATSELHGRLPRPALERIAKQTKATWDFLSEAQIAVANVSPEAVSSTSGSTYKPSGTYSKSSSRDEKTKVKVSVIRLDLSSGLQDCSSIFWLTCYILLVYRRLLSS